MVWRPHEKSGATIYGYARYRVGAEPSGRRVLEPVRGRLGGRRGAGVLGLARIAQRGCDRRDADLAESARIEFGALAALLGRYSSGVHVSSPNRFLFVPALKGRVSRCRVRQKWAETLPARRVFRQRLTAVCGTLSGMPIVRLDSESGGENDRDGRKG